MSKLVCTEDFLNELIKHSIIEPQGNNEFILYTKADLKGKSYPITITCDINAEADDNKVEYASNNSKTLNQWYDLIRVEFPTNSGAHLNIEGRALRSGNKTRIKKNITKLMDESFNLEAVIIAIRYEVWFRVKESTVSDNKLGFMQALEPWLNNSTNVEAMIERSQESNEFKRAMNINNNNANPSGTKRKIKLS